MFLISANVSFQQKYEMTEMNRSIRCIWPFRQIQCGLRKEKRRWEKSGRISISSSLPSSFTSPSLSNMEGDGMPVPGGAASATSPPSPPKDPHFSQVGSSGADDTNLQNDVPQKPDEPASSVDLDDLRHKIIKQVEFYFCDENLSTDKFLFSHIAKDKEGFVPLGIIASFKKTKKLSKDLSLIADALGQSTVLVVSSDGKKVKRRNPFLTSEVADPQLCTIVVENLPEDHSVENIQQIFGEAGNIKNVHIHDPNSARESRKCSATEKLLIGKLYALVEYETVEAAEKAVVSLNNEQDWRYGMRVKCLKKRSPHGQKKKNWKEMDTAKNNISNASDALGEGENPNSNECNDDTNTEEKGEHLSKEKNVHKGQNRGRGRRQKYSGANAQGHGHGSTSSGPVHVETSKPPPGPKMPDGTKGFVLGRGKPPS